MAPDSKKRITEGAKKSALLSKKRKIQRINSHVQKCICCNQEIPYEKRRNKYCSHSCAARENNKGVKRNFIEDKSTCLYCLKPLKNYGAKYCSRKCHRDFEYNIYINNWKNGFVSGLTKEGVVTPAIKRFLREKYCNKCSVCGWSKINPYTKKTPLVADHIDGNWQNNTEENLRLLCGCCDSLTSTYCALNTGNGRKQRLNRN